MTLRRPTLLRSRLVGYTRNEFLGERFDSRTYERFSTKLKRHECWVRVKTVMEMEFGTPLLFDRFTKIGETITVKRSKRFGGS